MVKVIRFGLFNGTFTPWGNVTRNLMVRNISSILNVTLIDFCFFKDNSLNLRSHPQPILTPVSNDFVCYKIVKKHSKHNFALSSILKPLNALSRSTELIACLIAFTLALEKPQVLRPYEEGNKAVKLTYAKTDCWWHLGNSEGITPESVTKFFSVVKIKLIQDAEFGRIWIGPTVT